MMLRWNGRAARVLQLAALASLVMSAGTARADGDDHDEEFGLRQCIHGVVRVDYIDTRGERGVGTGTMFRSDGWILTNYHVVERAVTLYMRDGRALPAPPAVTLRRVRDQRTLAEESLKAFVVATNPELDLAVLRLHDADNDAFDRPTHYPYVPFGEAEGMSLGQTVHAVGFPLGSDAPVATTGTLASFQSDDNGDWLDVDARFNPGNSGGALITTDCHLIGVPTRVVGLRAPNPISQARPINELVRDWANGVVAAGLGESLEAEGDPAHAGGGEELPQQCDGHDRDRAYGALEAGDDVVISRHREVDGSADWTESMDRFVGRRATVMTRGGVDEAGCPTVRVDLDHGVHRFRVRDLRVVARRAHHIRECPADPVMATTGGVHPGTYVTLGEHDEVNDSRNWAPMMQRWVGQVGRVTQVVGVDAQNCPVVRVDVDHGRWFWRIRNLTVHREPPEGAPREQPIEVRGQIAAASGLLEGTRNIEAEGCLGIFPEEPAFELQLAASSEVFVATWSTADTTLAVQQPDGSWVCNDDTFGLRAGWHGEGLAAGRYRVFVGAYGHDSIGRPYRAVAATSAVTPDEIDPGREERVDLTNNDEIPGQLGSASGNFGDRDAHARCTGFFPEEPAFSVTVPEGQRFMRILTHSAVDTTLAVLQPDGTWQCNDDRYGLMAGLDITNPAQGEWRVYIGTFSPEVPPRTRYRVVATSARVQPARGE